MTLYQAILDNIDKHPDAYLLPQQRRLDMADALTSWVLDSTHKYYRGQREHGGDICDRNLRAEIREEQIDQFWFSVADGWKKDKP